MNQRVRQILAEVLDVPEREIDERLSAEHTSNWDSIRQINVVLALEEAFGVSFSSDEIASFTSYRAIAEALASRGIT